MNLPDDNLLTRTLADVGERFIKTRIIKRLQQNPAVTHDLFGGLGHDSGIVRPIFDAEELLLVNTDKSGVSKAYTLGLAGGECIGYFAISHAVSDILASGGTPFATSIAMLLPGETTVQLVDEIVDGVKTACLDYSVTLTGGDTKKNNSLSLVVTALGRAMEKNLLFRNRPRSGDRLVVTDYLGSMLLGSVIYKRNHNVSKAILEVVNDALIWQRPPYNLGLAMSGARIANACTDISDGLPAACRNLISDSALGVMLNESEIPIHPALRDFANSIDLSPLQMSMAGGDWRFLYAIPEQSLNRIDEISAETATKLTVVGNITQKPGIWATLIDGAVRELRPIEHDAFAQLPDNKSYFEYLSDPKDLFL